MDWYAITSKYHGRTFDQDARLAALQEDWQRELAAIWRLEADVNNGAYLQFLCNWGYESYKYASQALKKIGALKMVAIIDECQALIDKYFDCRGRPREEYDLLMPNPIIGHDGTVIKAAGSVLPEEILERINALSCEFMAYPEDVAQLGLKHYRSLVEADNQG